MMLVLKRLPDRFDQWIFIERLRHRGRASIQAPSDPADTK